MAASPTLDLVQQPDRAAALLHPLRLRILQALREPGSASSVAEQLGLPRQRVNYHLRQLEKDGLAQFVEERRKGNCVERILRATASHFLITPEVLGDLAANPDEIQDRFSSTYLLAVAAQAIRDLAALRAGADAVGKRLATLTLQCDINFASPSARNAFADELAGEVARPAEKYHDDTSTDARCFRLLLGASTRSLSMSGTRPAKRRVRKPNAGTSSIQAHRTNKPQPRSQDMSQAMENTNVTGTRAVEEEIIVAAPVESVWRALTDAEELTNWFPTEAGVEPGEGGKIWLAWEKQFRWDLNIDAWQPHKHLRASYLQEVPTTPGQPPAKATKPVKIAMDFYLSHMSGGTIVRVVHSGFGPDSAWDNEYYGVLRGWRYELRSLQHYLERHPGVARSVAWARTTVNISVESAWESLTGSEGLIVEGSLAGLEPDSPYSFRTAAGEIFRGVVRTMSPPFEFSGTVENLGDSMLRLAVEPITGDPLVWIWLATYGLSKVQVDELQGKFQAVLDRVYGDST